MVVPQQGPAEAPPHAAAAALITPKAVLAAARCRSSFDPEGHETEPLPPELDPELELELEDPELDPDFEPELEPELDPELDPPLELPPDLFPLWTASEAVP